MSTSLLKFSFKTGLVKAIISEIASNISKYYYTFGKADPWFTITGLTATVVENSNTIVLTNGSVTTGFIPGQLLTQNGGVGTLGLETRIETIVSETEFSVTVPHVLSGDVVFSVDDESVIEQVIDSYEYEIGVRNNTVLYKQIDANDVAPVVLRHNWVAGIVFDMYREYTEDDPSFNGATTLDTAVFYVVTDQYQVYKCLDNNNNSPSQNKPTGTSEKPITTDDSYVWKYMYTIPPTLRNKFLSTTLMPVSTALTTQFYTKGAIVGYSIENQGAGYTNASYSVTGFRILSGGIGYTTASIIIEAPHQDAGTQAVATVTLTGGIITSISMNPENNGYSYPPTFSIVGDATIEAVIEPIIEVTGLSYTELVVDGDGYLEENPYVVGSVEILNGGTGYDTITLLFTNPDLPNGVKASTTVTIVDGIATAITVDEEGYGYSNPFYSISDNPEASNLVEIESTGAGNRGGFQFRVSTKKNNAKLAAIVNVDGQIEQVLVVNPGIGYTYASVSIETDFDTTQQVGFDPASIILDFGVGAITSNQSTVEITAVPGAIYAVYVKSPGFGYGELPTVTIVGDGTGAIVTAEKDVFGSITKINIVNPGYGYTVAAAILSGSFGTEDAVLDVVLPPKNGHGSDAISELYTKTIMFRTVLFKDTIFKQPIDNSFRQICLVKNPKVYNSKTNLRLGIASNCILAIGSNAQTDFNRIYPNDILLNNGKRYLVVSKYDDYTASSHALLLNYLDNSILQSGDVISKQIANVGASFAITSVIAPAVNKFSGEILTIDNRVKFSPSEDQLVIATNTISF